MQFLIDNFVQILQIIWIDILLAGDNSTSKKTKRI